MSEMLGKITFFLLIWNLKNLGIHQESKTTTGLTDKKPFFSEFLTWVALEGYKFSTIPLRMFNLKS
jgi:hypothetical protein